MGFMDKARKLAEQAQKEAKDGTLKERAKALADQAQSKLGEVQTQFNESQRTGGAPAPGGEAAQDLAPTDEAPAPTPGDEPPAPAAAAPTPPPAPAAPAMAPPAGAPGVDRSHEAAPKLTGGDPLAG
jgi:hypothetical protein